MNFRTTVILLVLLAGALVFYIAANWSAPTDAPTAKKDEDRDKGRKLLDVKADDVRKLVVKPGDGAPAGSKTVEMTQADGKWTITQPVNWPADSFEGRNFVDAGANARSVGSVDLDAEGLPFGDLGERARANESHPQKAFRTFLASSASTVSVSFSSSSATPILPIRSLKKPCTTSRRASASSMPRERR